MKCCNAAKYGATGDNRKCTVVMVSSYLERPLRTVAQVLEARALPAATSGPGSVEVLVRLLTEDTNQNGALEAPAPANRRPSLDRRRAA